MQTVKLAMEMKLASLGHVSLDGSKFKANSSSHKAMNYKFLKKRNCRPFVSRLRHCCNMPKHVMQRITLIIRKGSAMNFLQT